jgi:TonB family protein
MNTIVGLILLFSLSATFGIQPAPRIAVIDIQGDGGALAGVLHSVAENFETVDADQVRAALRGAGYADNPPGYMNPSLDDARALGAAVGCDYYFAGRVAVARRLGAKDEHYFEAVAALYLVEARSGRLVMFDYARIVDTREDIARSSLIKLVEERKPRFIEAVHTATARRMESAAEPPVALDAVEILDGETAARGLTAPVFYQRLKPGYTEEAQSVELQAVVELAAVFGADAKVHDVEVLRWAGFGLDESAISTVRKLRFKPAERDGRALSVRALVRYTFRRPPSAAEREAEAERLRRSLRNIQRPL